jgi:hypothetical protein
MSLIFPLVAAGAPDPLRASWTLTKHHVARIASVSFITMISTILLLLIIYVPCRIELRTAGQLGWIQSETATKVIESLYLFACSTLGIGALAAMASNFSWNTRSPMQSSLG